MRDSGARLFPVALVALMAALTFWLDQATQQDDGRRDGKLRHDPDYIVDHFQVRRFDADGELQHLLVAQKMLHYPDDDTTRVIAPHLTYQHVPPTHIEADTAWLDKDGKHVRLDNNVRVVRESSDERPQTEITTSVLYAEPDDNFAHTDAPVKLTQGKTEIFGKGMEANGKTHISVLFGPVHGTIYATQAEQANPLHERSPNEIKTPAHLPPAPPAGGAGSARRKG